MSAGRGRTGAGGAASVAEVWGEQAGTWSIGGVRHWTELARVQAILNRRVSGDEAVDPYLWFLRTRLEGRLPVARALTIGCGGGDLERGLATYGFAASHDAFDVAPGAIERARTAASEAGPGCVRDSVANGNDLKLEASADDVVFGVHSIHHIERLERLFEQIARSLKPDGLFFMNEFVGPTRFQWSDRQLEVVNGLLRALPARYRRSTVGDGLKERFPRPTVAEMVASDPSEAVRSSEILALAEAHFELLEVRPYGGTILHLLLHDIAGNFSGSSPGGPELLEAIADLEWALVSSGDLPSDFAVVVARPRR
ncbi:MAG TPA: class I SAM-dependent methyltransferase [Thermoanaerobaculia bacterium]|nr:class I SAM-dependent methyltransferase [Thermoanaerobaculia bacterium]